MGSTAVLSVAGQKDPSQLTDADYEKIAEKMGWTYYGDKRASGKGAQFQPDLTKLDANQLKAYMIQDDKVSSMEKIEQGLYDSEDRRNDVNSWGLLPTQTLVDIRASLQEEMDANANDSSAAALGSNLSNWEKLSLLQDNGYVGPQYMEDDDIDDILEIYSDAQYGRMLLAKGGEDDGDVTSVRDTSYYSDRISKIDEIIAKRDEGREKYLPLITSDTHETFNASGEMVAPDVEGAQYDDSRFATMLWYVCDPGFRQRYDDKSARFGWDNPYSTVNRMDDYGLDLMTDAERAGAVDLWESTHSKEAFYAYIDYLGLTERNAKRESVYDKKVTNGDFVPDWASSALDYTFGQGSKSVIGSVVGEGMRAGANVINYAGGIVQGAAMANIAIGGDPYGWAYGATDPNSPMYRANRLISNISQNQVDKLTNVFDGNQQMANLVYSVISSSIDSAISMGTGSAVGKIFGEANNLNQIGKIGETVGLIIMSNAAGSASLQRNVAEGMNPDQALLYAFVDGAIEYATEKVSVEALFREPKNMGRYFVKAFVSEGSEELAGAITNDVLDPVLAMITGNPSQFENAVWKYRDQGLIEKEALKAVVKDYLVEAGTATLSGALSGGLMAGGHIAAYYGENVSIGNSLTRESTPEDAGRRIASVGMTMEDESIKQASERVLKAIEKGQTVSLSAVGKLYRQVYSQLDAQSRETITATFGDAVKARMHELGSSDEGIEQMSDAIIQGALEIADNDSHQLSDETRALLAQDENAIRVLEELSAAFNGVTSETNDWADRTITEAAKINQRTSNTHRELLGQDPITFDSMRAMTSSNIERMTNAMEGNTTLLDENADLRSVEKQTRTATAKINGTDTKVTLGGVVSSSHNKDGSRTITMEATTESGETVEVDTADLSKYGSGPVAAIITYAENSNEVMPAEKINDMVDSYNGGDVTQYIAGFNQAFTDGFFGRSTDADTIKALGMTEEEFRSISEKGLAARSKRNQMLQENQNKGGRGTGTVNGTDASKAAASLIRSHSTTLSRKVKRDIGDTAFIMGKLGSEFGFNTVMFADEASNVNGWFSADTNTIGINIFGNKFASAGTEGGVRYAMLRTASHEVTHFLEANAGEAYNDLVKQVETEYADTDMTLDQRVENLMEARANAGHAVTLYDAINEVVADAMEMMLRDSKSAQNLAESNPTLGARIAGWLKDFTGKVRKLFSGVTGSSYSNALQQGMHYTEEMVKRFDTAMAKAR